ncbi:hypothetical protein K502DRAFT_340235 [Neoconidiobolus thromboides FSU 785]|nr:hypothetical protein K502DRAFT_340235 [Neoconidiobolus thromboides FSU 785]
MLKSVVTIRSQLTKINKPLLTKWNLNVNTVSKPLYQSLNHLATASTSSTIEKTPLPSSSSTNAINFSHETKQLINKLRSQNKYYAVLKIKGKRYTVTENDTIVLGYSSELKLGDKLRMEQVTELGSKDYSIIGAPFVSEKLYEIEGTVVEHTQGPEINIVKFKKRKGYRREYNYRNHYTLIKVSKLEVNKME